jgi:hypothetical protein
MEYGGKRSKLFFNRQHIIATRNNLLKLVTNDEVTHDSPNYILKEEEKYFKHMFVSVSPISTSWS